MKLTLNLTKSQIRAIEFYLRRKYDSVADADKLIELFLLEFVAEEAKKESEAMDDELLENLFT